MHYKVTIAIPVFNTEPFIERCLTSALNQSFPNIEYLLLDDCSTDNTLEIIEKILEKSPRRDDVTLIKNEVNIGIGAIRDYVFKVFKGDYLFFLDGDDELFSNSIEMLYNHTSDSEVDIVIGSIKFTDKANEGRDGNWFMSNLVSNNPSKLFFKDRFYPMTWNKLYKRSLIVSNGISCISTNQEDEIISMQLFMYAKKVISVSEVSYKYYFRSNSLSNKMKSENFFSYGLSIEYLQELKSRFFDHPYYVSYLQYVYNIQYLMFWRLKRSNLVSENEKEQLSKKLLNPFLTFDEIIRLKSSIIIKAKFFLIFLPESVLFFLQNNFSSFFRKLKEKKKKLNTNK